MLRAAVLCAFGAALAMGDGACTDDADMKIWDSKGKADFKSDLSSCATKCFGDGACVTSCMKTAEGYSDSCSKCFGDVASCTKDHCLLKCIKGQTPACKECVDEYCTPALQSCSGLTPPSGAIMELVINV
mmetsp:Transcript_26628/g.75168  ORF Transcript_26628/g.75168 Transcript_26628/m.75168 type:complete len:130 (+) Transcript_26628:76-465(+)|eukprot:CAMPEP_0179290032 /NCGR_PEP_ID=MMETSP0797-20121207/41609_1 /TAXON_ID=47934 /ORGANISM="Dinophysis acuminata, Strain DAEP01" /LENGTH=129 /DNA_ID=CAMNT_0020999057 /DNA_START=70 /DNA_END=459 /DNA_ORIENTATION=-